MPEHDRKSASIFKSDIFLGIVQIVLACLFALVLYVFVTSFGGEFLIIAESEWILAGFATLLLGGAAYSTITAVMTVKTGALRGYPSEKIRNKTVKTIWVWGWSIWNIIAGIGVLIIYRSLLLWVIDTLSMVELIPLSIPFIGYGCLLLIGGIKAIRDLWKSQKHVRIMRGLTATGCAFLFVFVAFGCTVLLWNPKWAAGVEHQILFKPGMQAGRGYRIPSMLVVNDETGKDIILAFCESRADAMLDWGDIDLVMRRSADRGKTWSDIITLVDFGSHAAGNPCPVFDTATKTVWLSFCRDNKQVYTMSSKDYGKTWSEPLDITKQLNLGLGCDISPLCMEYGTGPGNGIQLRSKRLIVPSYYFSGRSKKGAHVIYSDDHGLTWHKGGDLGAGEEPQAFEATNGSLCINCRSKRGGNRYIGWSLDRGETWKTGYYQKDLPEAETQGSILRFTSTATQTRNRVLFTNPNFSSRGHLTLRMSYDEGGTWKVVKEIYSGPACYSQIGVLSDFTILVLFEAGKYDYRETLTLAKLDLEWLTEGKDRLRKP